MGAKSIEILVQKTLAGDRQSGVDLVGRYGRALGLVFMGLLGPGASFEGLARQAWRQALSEPATRRRQKGFGPRVTEIVSGLCRIKKAARPAAAQSESAPEWQIPPDLAASLSGLPEPLRLCIMLYYLDRQDAALVADMLNVSVPEVHDRLRQGLRCLEDPQATDSPPGPCHRMHDRIIDRTLGIPGQIESQAVRHHVEGCERCRRFYEHLRRLQERLYAAATQIDAALQAMCVRLIEEIRAMPLAEYAARRGHRHTVRTTLIACGIAVAIIAVFGMSAGIWWHSRNGGSGPATIPTSQGPSDPAESGSVPGAPGAKPPLAASGADDKERIPRARPVGRDTETVAVEPLSPAEALFTTGDLAGLIRLLEAEKVETRIAAAEYLAEVGDRQALEPLLRATATWTGNPAENPYVAALKEILARISVDTASEQADQVATTETQDVETQDAQAQDTIEESQEEEIAVEEEMDTEEILTVTEDPNEPMGFRVETIDPNDPGIIDPNEVQEVEEYEGFEEEGIEEGF